MIELRRTSPVAQRSHNSALPRGSVSNRKVNDFNDLIVAVGAVIAEPVSPFQFPFRREFDGKFPLNPASFAPNLPANLLESL